MISPIIIGQYENSIIQSTILILLISFDARAPSTAFEWHSCRRPRIVSVQKNFQCHPPGMLHSTAWCPGYFSRKLSLPDIQQRKVCKLYLWSIPNHTTPLVNSLVLIARASTTLQLYNPKNSCITNEKSHFLMNYFLFFGRSLSRLGPDFFPGFLLLHFSNILYGNKSQSVV